MFIPQLLSTTGQASFVPPTLRSRFKPLPGTLFLEATQAWENVAVLEPSIVLDDNRILVYYTGTFADNEHHIGVAISSTGMEGTFVKHTDPIIGRGYGGAPSYRNANCSFAFKKEGIYYVYATSGYGFGGEPSEVWLYTSTDGISFTQYGSQPMFPVGVISGVYGYGNHSIYPELVNGVYLMLLEGIASAKWEIYRATATSLMGPWTVSGKLSSMQPNPATMFGGPWHTYSGGKWHALIHYGLGGSPRNTVNLPTVLAYATSLDGINWTIKEFPFLGIEATPYPNTDQLSDPFCHEIDGKTYLLAEYVDNESPILSQIRMWKFDGTFEQLVSGI